MSIVSLGIVKERNLLPSEFFRKEKNLDIHKRSDDLTKLLVEDPRASINESLKDLAPADRMQILSLTLPRFTFLEPNQKIKRAQFRLKVAKNKTALQISKPSKKLHAQPKTATTLPTKMPFVKPAHCLFIEAYLTGKADAEKYITYENYKEVLQAIKIIDTEIAHMKKEDREQMQLKRSSYELRNRCLQASKGELPTFVAFTKSFEGDEGMICSPKSPEAVQRAIDLRNYVSDRQAIQGKVLSKIFIDALYVSRRFNQYNPERAAIFALAGNCGSGKTYMAKKAPEFSRLVQDPSVQQTFSPDNVKRILKHKVKGVTNDMVHSEGCKVYSNLQGELLQKGTHLTMIIDKCLQEPKDIDPYIKYAKKNGRTAIIKDIDCPLILSCLRVLTRDPNTEPCIPLGPIADNFKLIRGGKQKMIDFAKSTPEIVNYELHVLDDQAGYSGLAGRKTGDKYEIGEKSLYDFVLAGSDKALSEASLVQSTRITDALLGKYKQFGLNVELLQPFKGLTIEEALKRKSMIMPSWE